MNYHNGSQVKTGSCRCALLLLTSADGAIAHWAEKHLYFSLIIMIFWGPLLCFLALFCIFASLLILFESILSLFGIFEHVHRFRP